jgi:hypothetical protein
MDYADYVAHNEATSVKWITPADRALIEAIIRAKPYSSDTDDRIAGNVRAEVCGAAQKMEWDPRVIPTWAAIGLDLLTDGVVTRTVKRTDPGDLASFVEKIESDLAEREAEADEEYPVDTESHALARRWLAITPYVVWRFHCYVLDAAVDAARDAAEEMVLGERDSGRDIPDATEKAALRWVKEWEKGKVL